MTHQQPTARKRSSRFKLRFPERDIRLWASRYSDPAEPPIEDQVAPRARKRKYLDRDGFLAICAWKSPRTKSRCASNTTRMIEDTTRIALSTENEQLAIEVLTLLKGVSWPTASVILHFCRDGVYPILDFRALWSLRCEVPPQYDCDFWWSFTEYFRALAHRTDLDARMLDRALWQFSKERQTVPARMERATIPEEE